LTLIRLTEVSAVSVADEKAESTRRIRKPIIDIRLNGPKTAHSSLLLAHYYQPFAISYKPYAVPICRLLTCPFLPYPYK